MGGGLLSHWESLWHVLVLQDSPNPWSVDVGRANCQSFNENLCLVDDFMSSFLWSYRLHAHRRMASLRGQSSVLPYLPLPSMESWVGYIAHHVPSVCRWFHHLLPVPICSRHWARTPANHQPVVTVESEEHFFKFWVTKTTCIHFCWLGCISSTQPFYRQHFVRFIGLL
jgi:hypothetical protein